MKLPVASSSSSFNSLMEGLVACLVQSDPHFLISDWLVSAKNKGRSDTDRQLFSD